VLVILVAARKELSRACPVRGVDIEHPNSDIPPTTTTHTEFVILQRNIWIHLRLEFDFESVTVAIEQVVTWNSALVDADD